MIVSGRCESRYATVRTAATTPRGGAGSPARINVCFSELTLTAFSKALIASAKSNLTRPRQATHDLHREERKIGCELIK